MGSWKDEYKIGVTIIDNQHKQLFDAYDEFLHKLQENKTKEAKEVLIQRLKQYTLFHFATEERYMKQISFKGLDIHKNEHIYFIEKINSFEKKFNENKLILPLELASFIKEWLVKHILKTDKDYVVEFKKNKID